MNKKGKMTKGMRAQIQREILLKAKENPEFEKELIRRMKEKRTKSV